MNEYGDIMLSDVSQTQKDKYYTVPLNMMNLGYPLPFPDLVWISPHPILRACERVSGQSLLTVLFSFKLPLCCWATHNTSCLSAQGTMVFQMRAWKGQEWLQNQRCGQPFRMCHCSVGNRKGFATDKKRRYTFCQEGITKPSTKISSPKH